MMLSSAQAVVLEHAPTAKWQLVQWTFVNGMVAGEWVDGVRVTPTPCPFIAPRRVFFGEDQSRSDHLDRLRHALREMARDALFGERARPAPQPRRRNHGPRRPCYRSHR